MNRKLFAAGSLILTGSLVIANAQAQESGWSLSPRVGMSIAGGTPANDLINYGLAGRFRLDPNEFVGASLEVLDFDFERPSEIAGVRQDKTREPKDIDSLATSTLISVFYQRGYGPEHRGWNGYWTGGFGLASVDAKDAQGPAMGGGRFDMSTDAGTEWFPFLGGGVRYHFTRGFSADFGATANHHFADWKVTDRQSGRTGTVDNYTRYAFQLGLSWNF